MNMNQLGNMILRIVMRKVINKGINAGAKRMRGAQKNPPKTGRRGGPPVDWPKP